MEHTHRPHFSFHLLRDWLDSHSQIAASVKTFGIALGATLLVAIVAVLMVKFEWSLKVPSQVFAAADLAAGESLVPIDMSLYFPEQFYEQARTAKTESLPAQF